ncbi:hypothetical protein PSPO01_06599 [Paraphaeosphaeria sporulosa]
MDSSPTNVMLQQEGGTAGTYAALTCVCCQIRQEECLPIQQQDARVRVCHAGLEAFIRDLFNEDNPVKELQILICHALQPGHKNHKSIREIELLSILRAQANSPIHFTCQALHLYRRNDMEVVPTSATVT